MTPSVAWESPIGSYKAMAWRAELLTHAIAKQSTRQRVPARDMPSSHPPPAILVDERTHECSALIQAPLDISRSGHCDSGTHIAVCLNVYLGGTAWQIKTE